MISKVANPSIEAPQIDLSKLGVSLSDEALQRLVDAVAIAITPTVASSIEQQTEQRVRAEVTAEITTEVTTKLQADWDARFDQAVETALATRVQTLYEQIALARRRLFGRSSEALGKNQLRLGLFNEPEALSLGTTEAQDHVELPPTQDGVSDKVDGKGSKAVDQQTAARARGKRRPLPPGLPSIDVVYDLQESERLCACGTPMVEIGEEVSEQLDIIPMQIRVLRHVRKRYACADKIQAPVVVPKPPQVLPKSNASPRLLATLITLKYVDGLPLARAEHVFKRSGVHLPRQTQARLIIQVAKKLQPIVNLVRDHMLDSPFIHMDETRVQVLKEPGRAPQTQSFMWVQTAGPPGRKIVLFDYETSREATVPDRLLSDYSGYLMTDGYASWVGKKDGMTHLACWAHARRGFVEAKSLLAQGKTGKADEMLSLIGQLYKVEKAYKDATVEDRLKARQSESVPALNKIRKWLDDNIQIVLPSHRLGQAIAYTDKLWTRLVPYAGRGDLPIDNNPAYAASGMSCIMPRFGLCRLEFASLLFCSTYVDCLAA
jgi:transposase